MSKEKKYGITRRQFMVASAGVSAGYFLGGRASAAEFNLKLATGQAPDHPMNTFAQKAIHKIREATNGQVNIRLFPANQLGEDTNLITQVRSGGIDFYNGPMSILASFVPAAGIVNIGFAFKDYDTVWKAMDGDLGDYIRGEIDKTSTLVVSKAWDNGFRQITSSASKKIAKPDDLKGFKIRVPVAPILTSLFDKLGASPTPLNFSELYSALQTGVVDGEENPLPIIATTNLAEVQHYCSLTSHVWGGFWIIGNKRSWGRLPKKVQEIISREFDHAAVGERTKIAELNKSLKKDLQSQGMRFIGVDRDQFRQQLAQTSFYDDWRTKFGDHAWSILEKYSGKLG